MKLTEEELNFLKYTLRVRITYKEIYDEVYDHVLTALEHRDDKLSFTQAFDSILINDFGRFAGLRLIEKKRSWAVARQVLVKQLNYFIKHFMFPLLPLTVVIYGLIYYLVFNLNFSVNHFFFEIGTILISVLCSRFRMYRTDYIFKNKRSIKEFPFFIITFAPLLIVIIFNILIMTIYSTFFDQYGFFEWYVIPPIFYSLLITLYIVYIISFIKLHLDEFKKPNVKLV